MSDKIARRDFLGSVALAGAAVAAGPNFMVNSAEAAADTINPILWSSASELAGAIRSKKLSSKAIVEAHLEQIAKVNPKLNAIVQLTADTARKEADEADAAVGCGRPARSSSARPMCLNSPARSSATIWSTAAPTTLTTLRAPRAAAAAARRPSFRPAVRRWVSAPTPAAAFESPRIFAALRRSNRPPAGCRAPGNSRSRWAPALRCFTSA
jgi:amidase